MFKMLFLVKLLLCLLVFNVFAELKVGDLAPDFTLKNAMTGQPYSLQKSRGKKIVYLNFFATWCPSCKEEMGSLLELHQKYANKNVEMIAIDVKENTQKIAKFIEKYKITFPILLDETALVAKSYQVKGFPVNIVIDGAGVIRFVDSRPPNNFTELFIKLKPTINPVNPLEKK